MAVTDTGPFAPFEWLLASRYLRPKRKEGIISVIALISFLGIMLGVATLIIVLSVMSGFRQELYSKLLGLNGHFIVSKLGAEFTDYDATRARLAGQPSVKSVLPLIEGQALLTNADNPGSSMAVYIRGMRGPDIGKVNLISDSAVAIDLKAFDASDQIILGQRLALALGVDIGGRVKVLTHRGKSTVLGIKPNSKIYTIAGLVEVGMAEYDRSLAFLPLAEAQAFFVYPDQVNMLEVLVDDPERVRELRPALEAAAGPEYLLQDWQQRNQTFFGVLDMERTLMFIIVSLIVLVAALNIISGMLMLVKDKTRDIAILRTMGASQGAIMRVFLMTGASIGIVGTIAGAVLGIVFARNIESVRALVEYMIGRNPFQGEVYFLSRLVARVDPWETGTIVAMALTLSILATLYPSWRASRLDPVKALRYE